MRSGRSLRSVLGWLALLLVALWLRADSDVLVASRSGVHFTAQGDPYYHMRRIAYTVARFPETLAFDRYLNFPEGGQVVWTPAFDWSIAALAWAWAGPDDEAAVERLAARAPALLGVATVLAVAWLARRRFSPAAGWLAGALLAVLPGHLLHSQVGQLDHHVAVALAWVGLLALAMAFVRGPSPGRALGLGLGFAGALLLWPGMLIHVGIVEAVLAAWLLLAAERPAALTRARLVALANATALLATAPFCVGRSWVEFGAWSPWVLSNFEPAFFAGAAAALALTSLAWGGPGRGATRLGRAAWAAGIGGLGLLVAFALLPELSAVLESGAGWFAKEEAFQQEVSELRPFGAAGVVEHFSLLFFAFPLAWAWLAWRCWRERAGAEPWLVLAAAATFLALALLQQRFGNDFSVLYALVWGWFFAEAVPAARVALASRPQARLAALAAAGLAAWLAVDSLLAFHLPRQRTLARARRDPAHAARGPLAVQHRLIDAAARWLESASPPTRGWLDPGLAPEYGLLCGWDAGHMVRYRARRPVVQDNFGVYGGRAQYEAAWRYFASEDEDEAVAILRRLGVRYVLADRQGAGTLRPYAARSMTGRLTRAFGSLQEGGEGEIPALRHHRLIWHQRSGGGPELAVEAPGFALGVFEIVPGARVVGSAAPGARVEASLALRTQTGRSHVHRAAARADAAGRWELVLPYPTDRPFSSAVRAEGTWQIQGGGRSASLELSEEAVQSGATVRGPAF